jgi:hypothetical protein
MVLQERLILRTRNFWETCSFHLQGQRVSWVRYRNKADSKVYSLAICFISETKTFSRISGGGKRLITGKSHQKSETRVQCMTTGQQWNINLEDRKSWESLDNAEWPTVFFDSKRNCSKQILRMIEDNVGKLRDCHCPFLFHRKTPR